MVSEKKRAQQLKQPDEFQKKAFRLLDWVVENKSTAIGILIPVGLAVVGGFGWKYMQKAQGEDRREKIAKIDKVYLEESEKSISDQEGLTSQIADLRKQLDDLKTQIKEGKDTAEGEAKLSSLEAQEKTLNERLKSIKPDHKAAFEKYLAAYGEFKSKPEGWRAGIKAASIQISKKEYEKAADLLKDILSQSESEPFYQFQVRATYMSLLEEQGKFDQALEEKSKLLEYATGDNKPKALLIVGRLELLAGQKEKALETLEKVITEYNASQEARKARAFKALWQ